MSLFWPDKKVAVEIVDDPGYQPSSLEDDGWTVVKVCEADLLDHERFRRTMRFVASLVGGTLEQLPEGA